MGILGIIIFGIASIACLAYIIKELIRRHNQKENIEMNMDIRLSVVFYLMLNFLTYFIFVEYLLNVHPNRQMRMFWVFIVLSLIQLVDYGLARKRIIAANDRIIVYKLFRKKTVEVNKITSIKVKECSTVYRFYVGDKLFVRFDVRYYEDSRPLLRFISIKLDLTDI